MSRMVSGLSTDDFKGIREEIVLSFRSKIPERYIKRGCHISSLGKILSGRGGFPTGTLNVLLLISLFFFMVLWIYGHRGKEKPRNQSQFEPPVLKSPQWFLSRDVHHKQTQKPSSDGCNYNHHLIKSLLMEL